MSTISRKKCFWGVECGWCVRLTSSPPSMSWLSRKCEILISKQPYRPPRPVTGIVLLYGDGVCFLWGTNWTVSTATVASISQLTVSQLSRQCGILNISKQPVLQHYSFLKTFSETTISLYQNICVTTKNSVAWTQEMWTYMLLYEVF
jgi:hypothetical protein